MNNDELLEQTLRHVIRLGISRHGVGYVRTLTDAFDRDDACAPPPSDGLGQANSFKGCGKRQRNDKWESANY